MPAGGWGHAFGLRAKPDGNCVAVRTMIAVSWWRDSWLALKRLIEDEWTERPVDQAAWVGSLAGDHGLETGRRAVADSALLASVLAGQRGADARAVPVPSAYFTARDCVVLPRRAEQ